MSTIKISDINIDRALNSYIICKAMKLNFENENFNRKVDRPSGHLRRHTADRIKSITPFLCRPLFRDPCFRSGPNVQMFEYNVRPFASEGTAHKES